MQNFPVSMNCAGKRRSNFRTRPQPQRSTKPRSKVTGKSPSCAFESKLCRPLSNQRTRKPSFLKNVPGTPNNIQPMQRKTTTMPPTALAIRACDVILPPLVSPDSKRMHGYRS